ncbi:MAG TPA: hypothetical protein VJT77_10945 [Burkholderiales bacterium]|nr:hypothetical protein [Burkholderiales bacterium]
MIEPVEEAVVQHTEPVNPYGDVALGVECAWPTTESGLLPHAAQES